VQGYLPRFYPSARLTNPDISGLFQEGFSFCWIRHDGSFDLP
jgi:hypothetical protein